MLSDLGLEPIIQAGGPTTMYSGTRPRTEVLEAMREMAESFVLMDELLLSAGEKIAEMLGVEAATITSGASRICEDMCARRLGGGSLSRRA